MDYKSKMIVSVLVMVFASTVLNAQNVSDKIKPKWMRHLPNSSQVSYTFSTTVSSGRNLDELRVKNLSDFVADLGLEKGATAVTDYSSSEYEHSISKNGLNNDFAESTFSVKSTIKGQPVTFNAKVVDEYWQKLDSGDYLLTRLYARAPAGNKVKFDNFIKTEKYGAMGLWRSAIVPGWGQMYKGSYLKGGLIMGGTVALIGGTVFTSLTRQDYLAKMANTHSASVKQQYATNANNMATGMYCCIGGLAALYIYNLVDAIVAPGARRIVVKENGLAINF